MKTCFNCKNVNSMNCVGCRLSHRGFCWEPKPQWLEYHCHNCRWGGDKELPERTHCKLCEQKNQWAHENKYWQYDPVLLEHCIKCAKADTGVCRRFRDERIRLENVKAVALRLYSAYGGRGNPEVYWNAL